MHVCHDIVKRLDVKFVVSLIVYLGDRLAWLATRWNPSQKSAS